MFRFGRPKKPELSVVVPKELGHASFVKMLPTLDDYDPASLSGWMEWERKSFFGKLLSISSWLPGGEHHRFESLLAHLGLNSAEIKALRRFLDEYYNEPDAAADLREEIQVQLTSVEAEVTQLQFQLKSKLLERDEAQQAVLLAKIVFVEVAMVAQRRADEIERLLRTKQISLSSYRRQLDLLPQGASNIAVQSDEAETAEATA